MWWAFLGFPVFVTLAIWNFREARRWEEEWRMLGQSAGKPYVTERRISKWTCRGLAVMWAGISGLWLAHGIVEAMQ